MQFPKFSSVDTHSVYQESFSANNPLSVPPPLSASLVPGRRAIMFPERGLLRAPYRYYVLIVFQALPIVVHEVVGERLLECPVVGSVCWVDCVPDRISEKNSSKSIASTNEIERDTICRRVHDQSRAPILRSPNLRKWNFGRMSTKFVSGRSLVAVLSGLGSQTRLGPPLCHGFVWKSRPQPRPNE